MRNTVARALRHAANLTAGRLRIPVDANTGDEMAFRVRFARLRYRTMKRQWNDIPRPRRGWVMERLLLANETNERLLAQERDR